MVPRVAVDRKRSPIAAGMSEPAVRVFPRTAMPVVKVTTISPVVATAGAVPRVVVRPTTSPALCDMRPLQSCGAKSSFALPRVQVAVPLSVKSVAPPPPLPVVRVVKPRAQTSARPPLACPSAFCGISWQTCGRALCAYSTASGLRRWPRCQPT